MNKIKEVLQTDADRSWARKLKNRVMQQIFPSSAQAVIADALAQSIQKKQPGRLAFLLDTPLPSLFRLAPRLPDVEEAFTKAFAGLGTAAGDIARKKYPALYDNQKTPPLTAAVIAGFAEGARRLLAKGAAPFHTTTATAAGYTGALGAAIFLGKDDMMTLLMQQPSVQKELQEKPAFRNYLLLTALGTDCAATLAHLATCDPGLLEKARVYGDHKASDYTLGDGIFADREKLKLQRAFEESQKPKVSKYGDGPKHRPAPQMP